MATAMMEIVLFSLINGSAKVNIQGLGVPHHNYCNFLFSIKQIEIINLKLPDAHLTHVKAFKSLLSTQRSHLAH